MKKLDFNFIKSCFLKKGYNVISEIYINNTTPLVIEKDGFFTKISYANFYSNKRPQFFNIDNEFLFDNVKTLLSRKNNKIVLLNIKLISKNKKRRALCEMQCECGAIFTKLLDDIKSRDRCLCPKCSIKKRGLLHRKSKQEAVDLFNKNGYHILDINKDFLRNEYVEVEDQSGYRGFISYNRLLSHRDIAIFDIRTNKKNYIYNANLWLYNNGCHTQVLDFCDDKPYTRQGIICMCECGNTFQTSIASLQNGKIRCDICSKANSRYENIVAKFLAENNIEYIAEYRINNCKDILPLPFDFYICGKLIEIDGQGHYKPCHFNNISLEQANKTFEITKKHDEIKNKYCQEYKVPLLRIPYWEIENGEYKNKIIQFIKE